MSDGEEDEAISPLERPITDVTVEDVEVTCRDFVKFLVHLFSFRRILTGLAYLSFFLSIGYFYKVWLWVHMCVLERAGIPCREDFSLFSSTYPVNLSLIYGQDVESTGSFFSVDRAHFLCSLSGSTYVAMVYSVFWLLRRFMWPMVRRKIVEMKGTRRRILVRKNK